MNKLDSLTPQDPYYTDVLQLFWSWYPVVFFGNFVRHDRCCFHFDVYLLRSIRKKIIELKKTWVLSY